MAPTIAAQPSQHGEDTTTVYAPGLLPLAPHNNDLQHGPEIVEHSAQYDAEANTDILSAFFGSGNAIAKDVDHGLGAQPEANHTNIGASLNASAVVNHGNATAISSPATFLEACKLGINEEEVVGNEQERTDSKASVRNRGLPAGGTAIALCENGKARPREGTRKAAPQNAGRSQPAPGCWQVVCHKKGRESAHHVNEGQKNMDRAPQPAGRNSRNPSVNTRETTQWSDHGNRSSYTRDKNRQRHTAKNNKAAREL